MELIRRDADKKTRRMTWLIALAIHIIIGVIFYQTPQGQRMKDAIVDIVAGKPTAPPPPPKAQMKQVDMKKPTMAPPKFNASAAKVDPKMAISFKVLSSFDAGGDAPDFTSMAQNYSMQSFSLDRSQVANVTVDILRAIGVGDILGESRGIKVSGKGKRMRAQLNLCLVSTPGATRGGATGYTIKGGNADANDTLKSKVSWDYVFRKYNSVERARQWLKDNTQIQVTENTLTLNMENTFSDWVYNIKKRGALAVDSGSTYYEATALKILEHAVLAMEINSISGTRDFTRLARSAVFDYFRAKYDLSEVEGMPVDMAVKKIEDRFILREWRKKGLTDLLNTANALTPEAGKDRLIESIKPVYLFFRKAQALENPMLILCNVIGLEKIPEENMDVLRNYVENGGFIWIDDSGVAMENINNQNNLAQIFIHTLMKFDERTDLTGKEQETFKTLSRDDRNVQGIELGDPFPPYAHPQAFIPITVNRDVPVDVRIFNRLGILVKLFSWDAKNPMKAGKYVTKDQALAWNCDNNQGEPVESGNYFVQMQSGLYQKTKLINVSKLRMLDEKHPIMSVVHTFRNLPICTIESGSKFWNNRTYGNAAFGYYFKGRMNILYTEGAGLVAGMGDLSNSVSREMACKFLNNVIAFCLSDEDGVAIRP